MSRSPQDLFKISQACEVRCACFFKKIHWVTLVAFCLSCGMLSFLVAYGKIHTRSLPRYLSNFQAWMQGSISWCRNIPPAMPRTKTPFTEAVLSAGLQTAGYQQAGFQRSTTQGQESPSLGPQWTADAFGDLVIQVARVRFWLF